MMPRFALWLALRIVAAVALLVPGAARAAWRREWDAELRCRSARLRHLAWRTNMDLIRRALGSLPDAAWIRRQFTLDADAVHDAAHGVRLLLRTPGFTAIALLVFAIGIGTTTAMVSVADAILMRPLPVRQPERVMTIWQHNRASGVDQEDVAPGTAIDWMKRVRSFEAIAVAEPWRVNVNIDGREPELLTAARVSDRFFDVLGAPMLHGRVFLPHEYRRGAARAVILSHRMWRDRYGAAPSIVGRVVNLDDGGTESLNRAVTASTVVGVMPPGLELRLFDNRFSQPEPFVWLPKPGFEEFQPNLRARGFWNVLGRLAPGVSIDQARAELDTISAQLAREYPRTNKNVVAQVVPLRDHLAGTLRDVLPLLLGAAAILLTVACANVANLLLARGAGRGREFAVRSALGASRTRLVRQMLVENLLLAAVGGAMGLALARWTLDAIARLRPLDVALVDHVPLDGRAALIAVSVTIVAAVIAGLTPSLQLSRPAAAGALREGRSSSRGGVRAMLVVVEIAAALVLATGAGLLVRSFILIQRVDPGFRPDHVAVLQVFRNIRGETPQARIALFQQALERMRALPGVVAAGVVSCMPFGDAKVSIRLSVAIPGRPAALAEGSQMYTTVVGGEYFRAMGVPLIKGRLFDATDTAASRQVLLVSRSAAQEFWRGGDPLGSRVQFRFMGNRYDAEVVGVVGEVRHDGLHRPGRAELFLPHSQAGLGSMTIVVRTAPGSPVTIQALKEQLWALDPLQAVFSSATLEQLVSRTLTGRRLSLFLLGAFALATLLLAVAGVYGVMSFSTSQRMREFGVRMALGAGRRDIMRLVVGDGLKLAGAGVVAGVLLALPMMRVLRALLFGVTATDPATFVAVSALLVLTATVACYVPASRALKADPVKALRVD